MRRAALIAALIASLMAGSTAAAADSSAPPGDSSVTLSAVALPLIFNGEVVNYVFVTVKLLLTPNADMVVIHDKEPYLRDALVREAHRTPFVRPNDYNHLDDGRLKAAILREATGIIGPGKIRAVELMGETPQHRIASPGPASEPEIVP
jgi:hypothetical protein